MVAHLADAGGDAVATGEERADREREVGLVLQPVDVGVVDEREREVGEGVLGALAHRRRLVEDCALLRRPGAAPLPEALALLAGHGQ